ncbi:MAG: hypothetical protein O7H41_14975 [Planctomycetota bacterium]|nr:hypothetical protein [Planctomycetota bacterium]
MKDKKKGTKPGPEPDRLVIEEDPGEALKRLLNTPKKEPAEKDQRPKDD